MTTRSHSLTRRSLLQMLTAGSVAGAAMLQASEPKPSISPLNTLTDAEEVALGRKFASQLEREVKLLDIAPLTAYLNDLVGTLGKQSRRPNLRYPVKVVDSAVVNAVSLPGGYVYVYRGLLHKAQTESELVSVLAHEIGHVVGRHAANRIMLDFRARSLYEAVKKNILAENSVITDIIQKLGGAVVMLAMLQYSREDETEADLFGFYNMIRGGWDPHGMVRMFRMLRDMQGGDPDLINQVLSTHPAPGQRAQRIEAELQQVRLPSDLNDDSLAFRAMKLGLHALPPPPKPAPVRK